MRPIWHQRSERVQAHILVCFLAFVLWKSLEMWQQRAGLGNSPRTVLEELARIQSHDVVLPTAPHGQICLRCVTQPDPAQAALLDLIASASSYPSACGSPNPRGHRSHAAPDRRPPDQKCSANFLAKPLI